MHKYDPHWVDCRTLLMAGGCWVMARWWWLVACGCWLLVADWRLLAADCWLLAAEATHTQTSLFHNTGSRKNKKKTYLLLSPLAQINSTPVASSVVNKHSQQPAAACINPYLVAEDLSESPT